MDFDYIIESVVMVFVALMVVSIVIVSMWPLISNFLGMSVNVPNYNLWRPLADLIPLLAVLAIVVGFLRGLTKPRPQFQGY